MSIWFLDIMFLIILDRVYFGLMNKFFNIHFAVVLAVIILIWAGHIATTDEARILLLLSQVIILARYAYYTIYIGDKS